MPVRKGVGQSEATRDKQATFDEAAGHLLGSAARVATKYGLPFFVADMNAGFGYYQELELDGSPLILARHLDYLRRRGARPCFICAERDSNLRAELQTHMAERYPDLPVAYLSDQASVLAIMPPNAVGLTYWDPNGWSSPHNGLNKELLASIGHAHPRMDILITRACLSGRRVMSADHCKDNALSIDGYLKLTGKKCLSILEFSAHDWWAFGFASNWEQRPRGKLKFHPIESDEAQRLLTKYREGTRTKKQEA